MAVRIDPAGVEYLYIPCTDVPFTAGTLYVSFDCGVTWSPSAWNNDKTLASILVGGPDAPAGSHVVIPLGGPYPIKCKLSETPEVIIRDDGSTIEVRG